MTPQEFVALVKEGRIVAESGGLSDGVYETRQVALSAADPEAVTAEAFAQGVFPQQDSWDDALFEIQRLLA